MRPSKRVGVGSPSPARGVGGGSADAVTLYDGGDEEQQFASPMRAEHWSAAWLGWAPPASQNANLEPLIEGPAISLAARHAKVRRDGYAR
jgi:hypothetical protein